MIWMPGEPDPQPRGRWTEVTESFSMSMQCDHFDPRLKFKKLDFFQSQKVSCRESEVEEKSEAAYEFCKRMVLRRYNEMARKIEAQRHSPTPFPIEGPQAPHPGSRTNARAYEQHQERIAASQRSAPKALEPSKDDGQPPWEDKPVPSGDAKSAPKGEARIMGENYWQQPTQFPNLIRGENIQ